MANNKSTIHGKDVPEILDWISGEVIALEATLNQTTALSIVEAPAQLNSADPVHPFVRRRSIEARASDRMVIICDMAAECRAHSAKGAMLQVALAEQCLNDMLTLRDNEAEIRSKARQAGRLLYSVLAFMEGRFRLDRTEVVGGYYMGRHRDPDRDLRPPTIAGRC